MSVFLKGYNFEHTKMSIHLLSFNEECAIVKEAKDANLLSQESKLTRVLTCNHEFSMTHYKLVRL